MTKEQLILGAEVLSSPLTLIINKCIESETFPESWKEAFVITVLKKGDKTLKENYRTVSSLPDDSKLLEMIVCDQTTHS